MPNAGGDIPQRVSALESSVNSLHNELADVKKSVNEGFLQITQQLQANSKTNWGTIAAWAIASVGIWAAALSPLHADIGRLESDGKDRHAQLVDQAKSVNANRERIDIIEERLNDSRVLVNDIREHGSPITDRRLSILEAKVGVR